MKRTALGNTVTVALQPESDTWTPTVQHNRFISFQANDFYKSRRMKLYIRMAHKTKPFEGSTHRSSFLFYLYPAFVPKKNPKQIFNIILPSSFYLCPCHLFLCQAICQYHSNKYRSEITYICLEKYYSENNNSRQSLQPRALPGLWMKLGWAENGNTQE